MGKKKNNIFKKKSKKNGFRKINQKQRLLQKILN